MDDFYFYQRHFLGRYQRYGLGHVEFAKHKLKTLWILGKEEKSSRTKSIEYKDCLNREVSMLLDTGLSIPVYRYTQPYSTSTIMFKSCSEPDIHKVTSFCQASLCALIHDGNSPDRPRGANKVLIIRTVY